LEKQKIMISIQPREDSELALSLLLRDPINEQALPQRSAV
jgi:hypothetical protein